MIKNVIDIAVKDPEIVNESRKYIPILFSNDMVKALQRVDAPKTQTRRTTGLKLINENPDEWKFAGFGTNPNNESDKRIYAFFKSHNDTWTYCRCPYGQKGDMLWVRETWSAEGFADNYVYKADGLCLLDDDIMWYPSIHMPKNAARVFLEVCSVRLERIENISEEDALAEGITEVAKYSEATHRKRKHSGLAIGWYTGHRYHFFNLWEKIYGFDSLNNNPWVWVYTFKNVSDNDIHWHNLTE